MSAIVSVVSICLFVVAALVLWPSRRIQGWLLVLMQLALRLLLSGAIIALATAAVVGDGLFECLPGEEARTTGLWLQNNIGMNFGLFCSLVAVVLAVAGLPCLIAMDFARALVSHAAWLRRLHIRQPNGPLVRRPATAANPQHVARVAPDTPVSAGKPARRRSLDELLS